MKNNDNKIINIIFRVVIIGAFFMGIRTIYNFYVLMITYKGISGEDMFNRVASMVDDYVMFMVFMVASVVFSVLSSKLVNNNTFIIFGKGNKERTGYLNNSTKEALENYLNIRKTIQPKSQKDKDALF